MKAEVKANFFFYVSHLFFDIFYLFFLSFFAYAKIPKVTFSLYSKTIHLTITQLGVFQCIANHKTACEYVASITVTLSKGVETRLTY